MQRIESESTKGPQYVVITPVRNEAEFVTKTIDAMAAQTILPRLWVVVDDGSTDNTPEILHSASRRYPWLTVIRRPDRGFRKTGGGVVEAFYDGYPSVSELPWDFVVKLDGDLSFEPDYFERCLAEFAHDPKLGIGGGTVQVMVREGVLGIDSPNDPPFHVRGATKIYRRTCWEQIHPLTTAPGWDTIDEVKANMLGWRTRSFHSVLITQHRGTGAVNGTWANWFKNGLANYITGYHPAFMAAKCVKRLWSKPPVVASIGLWAGFCSGYFKRLAATEKATMRYLRQQQVRFLFGQPSIYRPK